MYFPLTVHYWSYWCQLESLVFCSSVLGYKKGVAIKPLILVLEGKFPTWAMALHNPLMWSSILHTAFGMKGSCHAECFVRQIALRAHYILTHLNSDPPQISSNYTVKLSIYNKYNVVSHVFLTHHRSHSWVSAKQYTTSTSQCSLLSQNYPCGTVKMQF